LKEVIDVSTIRNEETIGIIVGEATSTSFVFSSTQQLCPSRLDYLVVKSQELIDDQLVEIDVLAQVERVMSSSEALKHLVSFEALRRIQHADLGDVRNYGSATVLGFMHPTSNQVLIPRRSLSPGSEVSSAPQELLDLFYSYPDDEALMMGNLITRPEVNVSLTVSGLRRHLAIIAQTGAGKSYCAGVLIEELLSKGGSVVVIDPHADYALIGMNEDGTRHELSDRCLIFRNPASTGRYSERDVGNIESYTIAFSDLTDEEIFEIANVQPSFTRIRETLGEVLSTLRNSDSFFAPSDLINELETRLDAAETQSERSPIQSAIRYARIMARMRVFAATSTPTDRILAPTQVSVMDLSGLDSISTDYIVSKLLRDISNSVMVGEYSHPVFIVIEEAHNFIPSDGKTRSSPIIKRIAGEGRKFGVFLVVISQRPSKIHSDTLSQCNSQIIMKLTNPNDQEAVEKSSERMSKELLANLPGFNPGEAVVLGPVTKTPVMIRVRRRRTREGGADIDVVDALRTARRESSIDTSLAEERSQTESFSGSFGEE
jgi:DNA helicase HerA-like ATPase